MSHEMYLVLLITVGMAFSGACGAVVAHIRLDELEKTVKELKRTQEEGK